MSTIRQFAKHFPVNSLKESTVYSWKEAYITEVKQRIKACDDTIIKSLSSAKMGRPLMVGPVVHKQIQAYLANVREGGGVINTAITIAARTGIIQRFSISCEWR